MTQAIEQAKVYYPETIDEQPLPDFTPYSQVPETPRNVKEINRTDGLKLEGIEVVNDNPRWVNDIINARIDTASKNILSNFTFGDTDFAGGVYAGDISWNTSNGAYSGGAGILLNRNGIIGANGSIVTFSIDATTGNATFRGSVTASTITGGSISGTSMSASNISGTTITGGTITGSLVRTNSGSTRVQMNDSNNSLEAYVSNNLRMRLQSGSLNFYNPSGTYAGYIEADSSSMVISSALGGGATLLLGNGEISPFSNGTKLGSITFRWGDIYSQGDLNINRVYAWRLYADGLYLTQTSSNPSVNGQMVYYASGGDTGIRVRINGTLFQLSAFEPT